MIKILSRCRTILNLLAFFFCPFKILIKTILMSNLNQFSLIICAIIWISLTACQTNDSTPIPSDNNYVINGKIDTLIADGTAILSLFDPVTQVKTPLDTAIVAVDGSYELTFKFKHPDLYRIDFFKKQYVMLVIAEGQNNIQLDVEGVSKGKASIKGSPDSEKLLAYDNFRLASNARVVKPTYDAMRAASKESDHEAEIEAVQNYAHASEAHRVELLDFTAKEIGTSIALFGSMLRWTGDEEVDRLDKLVQAFKAEHPNLKMTKIMEDKVERFKKVAMGAITPAIVLPDTSGNTFSLMEAKGKYTLIDFWASWCTPCLLQIPDLKEAYAEYHPKGFEILGVSVDSKGDRWKNSIEKYDMTWPQVSDLKGWGSASAADYNVTFIPFNVLIDEDGKIIAKNLHSMALMKKLETLLQDPLKN